MTRTTLPVGGTYEQHHAAIDANFIDLYASGPGGGITTLASAPDYVDNLVTPLASKQATFIAPRTEGATVTLLPTDSSGLSVTPVACVVTVNAGLGLGFSRGFRGAGVVSFVGTAAFVDNRTPGAAKPMCALICTGLDTYEAIGGKA